MAARSLVQRLRYCYKYGIKYSYNRHLIILIAISHDTNDVSGMLDRITMTLTTFQKDPPSCSASGPDTCPKWHYCNVSSNLCKPCTNCSGKARRATSRQCVRPLTCSEGQPIRCPDLFSRHTNGTDQINSYTEGYLGSIVKTACFLDKERHEARLECHLNERNTSLTWRGDFSCVTLVRPLSTEDSTTTSTVSITNKISSSPPSTRDISSRFAIPVSACSLSLLMVIGFMIVVRILVQKYKTKHQTGNKSDNHVKGVMPPCQNENLNWSDLSPETSLYRSEDSARTPIQESEAPDQPGATIWPTNHSLHLMIDGQTQHGRIVVTDTVEETHPKLAEIELDCLQTTEQEHLDASTSTSRTRPCSMTDQYNDTRVAFISSNDPDRSERTAYPGNQQRIGGSSPCHTRVKTVGRNEPTENSWNDDALGPGNSCSQETLPLNVGSSSDSNIILHENNQTSEPSVTERFPNIAPTHGLRDPTTERSQFVSEQFRRRPPAHCKFTSDSLLMQTTSIFTSWEQTLAPNILRTQESEDSGISPRSRSDPVMPRYASNLHVYKHVSRHE
ncbi:hypothetical protein LSH36_41g12013 [Paralvinella palmiformis]|uniref:Uncharacterized protein n=1 Tax=Paralvinella palmiformis TaxID=53620 RepID=A0AAD9NFA2_9ANNE|nr:hypothetical protein LSH36_41g12013 [Paralvinella palmiformis]